jgi:glucokinase
VEPAWVTEQAHGGSNSGATAALDLFAECMGNIAGDHALTLLATGGVYLAGGVVAKIAPSFNFDAFRAAFCAKGLFASRLMRVPVKLVTNENLPVIGAARIAASL